MDDTKRDFMLVTSGDNLPSDAFIDWNDRPSPPYKIEGHYILCQCCKKNYARQMVRICGRLVCKPCLVAIYKHCFGNAEPGKAYTHD